MQRRGEGAVVGSGVPDAGWFGAATPQAQSRAHPNWKLIAGPGASREETAESRATRPAFRAWRDEGTAAGQRNICRRNSEWADGEADEEGGGGAKSALGQAGNVFLGADQTTAQPLISSAHCLVLARAHSPCSRPRAARPARPAPRRPPPPVPSRLDPRRRSPAATVLPAVVQQATVARPFPELLHPGQPRALAALAVLQRRCCAVVLDHLALACADAPPSHPPDCTLSIGRSQSLIHEFISCRNALTRPSQLPSTLEPLCASKAPVTPSIKRAVNALGTLTHLPSPLGSKRRLATA
ncbi:hypothetical protein B0J12DRAFT_694779 [Macrophomina phaseolina]|uniref:Uncharacterized protein n=1 Tax=Macrophomina phaseolina TaxID=35725 RepID=A0ABQ8GQK5_9PEZI|nr:hypothetical protein B0J12DRAFT_694779 [Macrophomina phaseolina]